jgi:hypothetical protein
MKKWERREHPLCTFDELMKEYGIELEPCDDPERAGKIPIVDDNGNLVYLDLNNISLEELIND